MFDSEKQNEKWQASKPESVKQLTDNLVVEVWHKRTQDGDRYDWNLVRTGKNEGQTYKTKRPEDLLELPMFASRLAAAFAESSRIPEPLRGKLARLSIALGEMMIVLDSEQSAASNKANGPVATNGFSFAA